MGGAQPLAATHGRRLDARRRVPADAASTCACATRYLDAQATRPRRGAGDASTRRMRGGRAGLGRPARQRRRGPAGAGAARRAAATWSPTRPAPTTSSTATCRRAGRVERVARRAGRPEPARALTQAARRRMRARTSRAMLEFHGAGRARRSTTATTSGRWRWTTAWPTPSPSPASCRPTSGRCSARARGRSAGSRCRATPRTSTGPTRKVKELFPTTRTCTAGSTWPRERIAFQGLPARICWLGLGERAPARAWRSTRWSRSGELKAPIVIGRDHLDTGSVASPNRETEAMRDGSDAVSRLAAAQRAAQHRRRRHLGQPPPRRRRRHGLLAARRRGDRLRRHATRRRSGIARVLWNDPATGVMRHADAGYAKARRGARRRRASICRCWAADGRGAGARRPRPARNGANRRPVPTSMQQLRRFGATNPAGTLAGAYRMV